MRSVWHKLTFAADTLSLHRIPGLEIWEDGTSVSHLAAGLAFASSGRRECFLKVPLTSLPYFQCALKHPSRYLGNTKTWAKRKALLTPARQSPNPNISQRIIRKSYKHQNCNAEKDRTLSSSLCVLLLLWSLVGKILPQLLPSRTFHWTWAFLSYYPILSHPPLPLENCDLLFDLKTEHLWLKDDKIQKLVSVNCWNPDLVWLYLTLKKERKNPTDKQKNATPPHFHHPRCGWRKPRQLESCIEVGAPGALPMGRQDIYLKTGLNSNRHREMSKYCTSRKRNEYNCLCSLCIMNNLLPGQSKSHNKAIQRKALLNQVFTEGNSTLFPGQNVFKQIV